MTDHDSQGGAPERPRRSLIERAADRMDPSPRPEPAARHDAPFSPDTTAATAFYQPSGPSQGQQTGYQAPRPAMPPEPPRAPSRPMAAPPSRPAPVTRERMPDPEPHAGPAFRPIPEPTPPPAQPVRPEITLDLDALAKTGLLTPRGERNHMSEEYRAIKRPLIQYAQTHRDKPNERANLIMITSAVPGEGKTFTSVNLAMSIAKERDINVVLIDADLSRPAVAPRLQVPEQTGLTDLLENPNLSIPDVLLRTNVPNLSLILAGRAHALGTELLASERAVALIDEIGRRYPNRIIIFDTSPVLASNEVGALSTQVGQIIMVVEAEKTTELEVKGALDVLSGCENVSLLLNKTRTRFGSGRFSNYYYAEYFKK